MSAFTTKKILYGDVSKIAQIVEQIRQSFASEGYEVRMKNPSKGDEIYITKGGLFKATLGLRSALKITMRPTKDGKIDFKASVSTVKQQLVPTVITMCFFSPVVIAQIWGVLRHEESQKASYNELTKQMCHRFYVDVVDLMKLVY